MKRFLITIVLVSIASGALLGALSTPAYAVSAPCTFTPASGITLPGGTLPCDGKLLATYIVELNKFFYRLAIVLAVLMITIGGFQWLAGMGNSGKIASAKETIEQAVIGLALAFTAYIIFSQIDQRFVNLAPLDIYPPKIEVDCALFKTQASCPVGACDWYCANGGVKRLIPNGVCSPVLGKEDYCGPLMKDSGALCNNYQTLAAVNAKPYPAVDSLTLTQLRTCIESKQQVAALLDTSQIFTFDRSHMVCNFTQGLSCGPCSHEAKSCHYGRKNSPSIGAEAVDYNALDGSEAGENALLQAIRMTGCGWGNIQIEKNDGGWHVHLSTLGCNL